MDQRADRANTTRGTVAADALRSGRPNNTGPGIFRRRADTKESKISFQEMYVSHVFLDAGVQLALKENEKETEF